MSKTEEVFDDKVDYADEKYREDIEEHVTRLEEDDNSPIEEVRVTIDSKLADPAVADRG